ncbi:hypothetical protein [Amycolatopsis sp. CA-126428]|uniref:hypothetical protein n=1 Tax=Amycolatopsis sp. CA-126428 TaxID=2073158 RepID=UPI000CD32CF9|nr:hypothetical protein [Amycolatopsis sp. CA-126428]
MFAKIFAHVATLVTILRTATVFETSIMSVAYFVSASAGHAELLVAIAYSVGTTLHVRETYHELRHAA